jgi:multimeric flavodoxin WrbA
MKILSLYGSPRKKYSFKYSSIIKNLMEKDVSLEYDEIFLQKVPLKNCNGCYQCMKKGEKNCNEYDNINPIIQAMESADGLIISCPVYVYNVSGLMKNFIDHLAYLLHRPRFFGKKAIVIITTLETGIKEVSKYLSTTVSQWGFDVVGTIGIKVKGFEQNYWQREKYMKQLRDLSANFLTSIKQNKKFPPKLDQLIFFHLFKVLVKHTKEMSPADFNYWQEKGWFNKNYFYKTRRNPFKLLIAKFVSFLVKNSISRNEKEKILSKNKIENLKSSMSKKAQDKAF